MTGRRPAADAQLWRATPPGVQPERDGWLLCLDCGAWFRLLHPHLRRRHGLSNDDYRHEHGLSIRHPLAAADVRAGHSQRIRERIADNPDWWADNFEHERAQRAAFAVRGRHRSAATSTRPERRATNQATWRRIGRQRASQHREVLDRRAQQLGHADLQALLTAQFTATNAELAALLGVTPAAAGQWRRRLCGAAPDTGQARQRVRQRALDLKAVAAGYRDFADLIESTRGEPVKPLARRTNLSPNTIKKHRCNPAT